MNKQGRKNDSPKGQIGERADDAGGDKVQGGLLLGDFKGHYHQNCARVRLTDNQRGLS
jgi:hypothetical protein